MTTREGFAFAGLWDEWTRPEGEIIESCTVLTTGPNSLVADLDDRMPVIVPQEKYDLWLDPDVTAFEAIRDILKPYDANLMRRLRQGIANAGDCQCNRRLSTAIRPSTRAR